MLMQLNPNFQISARLASTIWIYLYNTGQEELAEALSESMIEEGVELDPNVEGFETEHLLAFWSHHLLREGVIKKVKLH